MEFLNNHWLDITTTALGLAYILLEYKASVWMWVVGFFMQTLGIVLYYQKGLYADCGMEFYYLAMNAASAESERSAHPSHAEEIGFALDACRCGCLGAHLLCVVALHQQHGSCS